MAGNKRAVSLMFAQSQALSTSSDKKTYGWLCRPLFR